MNLNCKICSHHWRWNIWLKREILSHFWRSTYTMFQILQNVSLNCLAFFGATCLWERFFSRIVTLENKAVSELTDLPLEDYLRTPSGVSVTRLWTCFRVANIYVACQICFGSKEVTCSFCYRGRPWIYCFSSKQKLLPMLLLSLLLTINLHLDFPLSAQAKNWHWKMSHPRAV